MNRPGPAAWRAAAAGAAGSIALATSWHAAGLVSRAPTPSYRFTEYLTHAVGPGFVAAYLALAVGLGWMFGRTRAVALGMIAPLPAALLVEVARDPTSHNLFPFEVVLWWIPGLLLALVGAGIGRRLGGATGR